MHSINNLLKFNKSEKKELDFSSMNVSDLKIHQEKMKKIIANRKLVDSLSDRGERVKKQLSLVEELIKKREAESDVEVKPTETDSKIKQEPEERNVETLIDQLENLMSIGTKSQPQPETEIKTEVNVKPEKNVNYFARTTVTNKNVSKSLSKIENDQKLKEVKEKIKSHMIATKPRETKMMSVEEGFKLLKEHEQKIKEIQMKLAAEKLLKGQSVSYSYTFLERTEKENLKYRENSNANENVDEHEVEEDDDDEDYQCYYGYNSDDDDTNDKKSTGIDKVYSVKKERFKFRHLNDDLDKVD